MDYANPQYIKVLKLPINGATGVVRRLNWYCSVLSSHFDLLLPQLNLPSLQLLSLLFVKSLCWLTKPLSFLAHARSIDKTWFLLIDHYNVLVKFLYNLECSNHVKSQFVFFNPCFSGLVPCLDSVTSHIRWSTSARWIVMLATSSWGSSSCLRTWAMDQGREAKIESTAHIYMICKT